MLTISPKTIAKIASNARPHGAIFTVGYGGLQDTAHLAAIVKALGPSALVVDVRKVPAGGHVNKLWQQGLIKQAIGEERYVWKGNVLGGLSHVGANVKPEGLQWIRDTHRERALLLMCACEAPHLCHRSKDIFGGLVDSALANGPKVPLTGHLYGPTVCDAADMLEAVDNGKDECDQWDENTEFEALS